MSDSRQILIHGHTRRHSPTEDTCDSSISHRQEINPTTSRTPSTPDGSLPAKPVLSGPRERDEHPQQLDTLGTTYAAARAYQAVTDFYEDVQR